MNSSGDRTSLRGRYRRDPHPSLRPFVVEYWAMTRDLAAMGGFTITPDRFGELICCVDDLYTVGGGGKQKLPTCFFVGLLQGPLRIEAAGIVRFMAARLNPESVGRFMAGGPTIEPPGWKDATNLLGRRLPLVANLVERFDWRPVTDILDEVLLEEVESWNPEGSEADLIRAFVDGDRKTATVADEQDASNRQIERRVRRLTGTSPKQLACLSRFQKARDAIWANPAINLAGLAFDVGYSDQPHMTREFRRYSGLTPARFAWESAAKKAWLLAEDVAFLQEAGAPGG